MKIKSLKIAGFRGFNSEEFFDLNSDVILIHGINGSGKSSFTEAIEWLFYNDISRRRLSPCKGEYTSGIYLKNLNFQNTFNPFVEAVITDGIQDYKVKRELLSEKKSKLFLNDSEVVDLQALNINLQGHFRPMLAQVEISALVNTEQQERWEELSRILGQEELTVLRNRIIDLRAEKKDVSYKNDEQLFRGIARELESFNLTKEFVSNFENFSKENFLSELKTILKDQGCDDTKSVEANIKSVIALITGTEFGKRVSNLKIDNISVSYEANLFSIHCENLKNLIIKSSKAKLSAITSDFYNAGLLIYNFSECPFCLNKTLSDSRIHEIKHDLANDKEANDARQELQTIINQPEGFGTKLQKSINEQLPNLNDLKLISQNLGEMNLIELGGDVKMLTEKIETEISTYFEKLRLFYSGYNKALEDLYFHKKSVNLEEVESVLNSHILEIEPLVIKLNTEWNEIRNQILSKFKSTDIEQKNELRKWIAIEKALGFLNQKVEFIRKFNLIEKLSKSIQGKIEDFEKNEVENLLSYHSEEIKKYYEKLNIGETIQFKKIEVRDGQRRQAKLIAEDGNGQEINPVTIFSEAHVNSLSLSIYFPQRVDKNPDWDLIILDDPVQSMDEGHASSLIEILSDKLKENKQVITLTHSKHFAEDFSARFSSSNFTYLRFTNGGFDGPDVEISLGQCKDYLAFVLQFADGSALEREAAGNALRKAIEACIGEILHSKGIGLEQIRKWTHKGGLPTLFSQLEVNKIQADDIAKLKSLLNVPHNSSHSWSTRDVSPTGLKFGVRSVEEVSGKYITEKTTTI